jgi:hypothetical protein
VTLPVAPTKKTKKKTKEQASEPLLVASKKTTQTRASKLKLPTAEIATKNIQPTTAKTAPKNTAKKWCPTSGISKTLWIGPTPGISKTASIPPDGLGTSEDESTEVEDDEEDVPLSQVISSYRGKLHTICHGRRVPKVVTKHKKAKPSGLQASQASMMFPNNFDC